MLDGSGASDPNTPPLPLTYTWTVTERPLLSTAELSDIHAVSPTFTPDRIGAYTIQLVVNNGYLDSAPATVTFTVSPTAGSVTTNVQKLTNTVQTSPATAFMKDNAQKTLGNKLNALANIISQGNYADAQAKIANDLLKHSGEWVKDPTLKATLDTELRYISTEIGKL